MKKKCCHVRMLSPNKSCSKDNLDRVIDVQQCNPLIHQQLGESKIQAAIACVASVSARFRLESQDRGRGHASYLRNYQLNERYQKKTQKACKAMQGTVRMFKWTFNFTTRNVTVRNKRFIKCSYICRIYQQSQFFDGVIKLSPFCPQ